MANESNLSFFSVVFSARPRFQSQKNRALPDPTRVGVAVFFYVYAHPRFHAPARGRSPRRVFPYRRPAFESRNAVGPAAS